MTENLEEAISFDEAVERMMTPEEPEADLDQADDEADEAEGAEATGDTGEADDESDEAASGDDEDEGDPEGEPWFEITTETGKRRLTESQIKEGLMLKADHTRKTMAIAEERKAVEARMAEISQKEQQLSEALQVWAVPVQQEPDWEDLAQRMQPQEFALAQARYMKRKAQADQARNEWVRMQTERQEALVAQEREKLLDAVPEWRDAQRFEADTRKIVATATDYGFSAEELAGIADHRILRVLRDVMSYRDLQKAKPAATKKVADAPVTLKAGAKPAKAEGKEAARQKQRAKLKNSGSVDDAIELLFM